MNSKFYRYQENEKRLEENQRLRSQSERFRTRSQTPESRVKRLSARQDEIRVSRRKSNDHPLPKVCEM